MSKAPNFSKMTYAEYKEWYFLEQGKKECFIVEVSTRTAMCYLHNEKRLVYPDQDHKPTQFPTSTAARKAKWHHVQQSGIPMSHDLWEIVGAPL